MSITHAPRCTLARPAPPAWRVTLALPDGGPPIGFSLLAGHAADAAITALELAGPGSRIRRVERLGEW